jgi:hypothetical protein
MAESHAGITSMRGMIPDACKDGNSGDNGFYKFLLALVVILDIVVPVTLAYLVARTGLSRTFAG